jgi:hypothetical protein
MSQLVKTKRQANFKDFERTKKVVFNSFVCKFVSFFGMSGSV